jgi:hypothetical protein
VPGSRAKFAFLDHPPLLSWAHDRFDGKGAGCHRPLADGSQDEAAEMLLALDRLGETYVASDEELAAVDEALAQAGRGEFATEAEIEAAFARFQAALFAAPLSPTI